MKPGEPFLTQGLATTVQGVAVAGAGVPHPLGQPGI